jgi:hypothetical protein
MPSWMAVSPHQPEGGDSGACDRAGIGKTKVASAARSNADADADAGAGADPDAVAGADGRADPGADRSVQPANATITASSPRTFIEDSSRGTARV